MPTAAEETDSNEMGMYQDMFDKQVALSISQHPTWASRACSSGSWGGKPATPAAPQAEAAADGTPAGAPSFADRRDRRTSPAEFVNRVMPSIRRAAAGLGLNPSGMLAQAALETGWGQRMPRNADGSPSHNMFGIKAGDEWTRRASDRGHHGVQQRRRDPAPHGFRAYGSIEESVNDFANLLKNSPRYRDAIAAGAIRRRLRRQHRQVRLCHRPGVRE